jgi:hypothetical protein
MNSKQLELQQRIKLLMEYDMKKTLTENIHPILEQGVLKNLLGLSDNVLDDIVTASGKGLKTSGKNPTLIQTSDDLKKAISKNLIDDVAKQLLLKSTLKSKLIPKKIKEPLIQSFTDNSVIVQMFGGKKYNELLIDFKDYPKDVKVDIAKRLANKGSTTTTRTNVSNNTSSSKPNVSNNVDDVFAINQKKLKSDLELRFPKAKSSDINKLVENIKLGLPKSQKEFETLFTQAINHHAPNYKSMLQNQANRVTYWEKFQTLSWKLKAALLALASYPTCNYIVPVFGTDCTTLISDIINNLTQGAYDTAKKIKRPNTGAASAPAQTTGNNSIIQDAETFLKNNNYWAQGMELTPTNNPDEVSWKMATGETGTIKKQQDGTFK